MNVVVGLVRRMGFDLRRKVDRPLKTCVHLPPEDHAGDELPVLHVLVAAVLHEHVGAQPVEVHVEEDEEEEAGADLLVGCGGVGCVGGEGGKFWGRATPRIHSGVLWVHPGILRVLNHSKRDYTGLFVERFVPKCHVLGEPASAVSGVQERIEECGLRGVFKVVHHCRQDEDSQEPVVMSIQ